MVPPSARFPTRRTALAEEAARRALAGLGPELVLPQLRAQTVQELLAQCHPMLCDLLPLSLEEIFIYELGGVDYDVKNIVL